MRFSNLALTAAAALTVSALGASTLLAQDAPASAEGDASAVAPATQPNAGGADAALAEIKGMTPPQPDMERREDQAYVQQYMKERTQWQQKMSAKVTDFVEKYPEHPEAGQLLIQSIMMNQASTTPDKAAKRLGDFLEAHPKTPARADLMLFKTSAMLASDTLSSADKAAAVASLKKELPDDPRVTGMEVMRLQTSTDMKPDEKLAAMKKLIEEHPGDPAVQRLSGAIAKMEKVGKPVELKFTEAVSGKEMSLADLKGQVVVLDFWATWCGPCVAELPTMKKIYAEYHPKGVEFVGISLDQPEAQGGKDKLLAFVKQNDMPWPQYYQGNGWQSEFSSSWGIDSIPAVFVIDAEGNLANTDARGKLESILPELLKKRDDAKSQASAK